jgi:hypothetical protein
MHQFGPQSDRPDEGRPPPACGPARTRPPDRRGCPRAPHGQLPPSRGELSSTVIRGGRSRRHAWAAANPLMPPPTTTRGVDPRVRTTGASARAVLPRPGVTGPAPAGVGRCPLPLVVPGRSATRRTSSRWLCVFPSWSRGIRRPAPRPTDGWTATADRQLSAVTRPGDLSVPTAHRLPTTLWTARTQIFGGRVGFIGLGVMGRDPWRSASLFAAGPELVVWKPHATTETSCRVLQEAERETGRVTPPDGVFDQARVVRCC